MRSVGCIVLFISLVCELVWLVFAGSKPNYKASAISIVEKIENMKSRNLTASGNRADETDGFLSSVGWYALPVQLDGLGLSPEEIKEDKDGHPVEEDSVGFWECYNVRNEQDYIGCIAIGYSDEEECVAINAIFRRKK